jgi:hypothetical protein
MKRFIAVTSSWRLGQNTGMHYDARDSAELTQRLDVRPIFWNKVVKLSYGPLAEPNLVF